MKRFIALLSIALPLTTYTACISSKETTTSPQTTTKSVTDEDSYTELLPNQSVRDLVGKKVWFEGKLSSMVQQHMMKSGMDGTPPHIYIDFHNGRQIVGYLTNSLAAPEKVDQNYRFYGRIGSMSGAGKGGGVHMEYYIDLTRIE